MKTLFASLIILSSMSSFAALEICQVRDLSLAQQTELKKITDEASEKIKPLSLEVKNQRALLNRIMQNPQALKVDADNVNALISANSLEIKSILTEKNSIISFDILSPEQRVKKARCLAASKNPRAQTPSGRVIVQRPVRRPHYRPVPVRYPRVGRGHPMPARRVSRRVFP